MNIFQTDNVHVW